MAAVQKNPDPGSNRGGASVCEKLRQNYSTAAPDSMALLHELQGLVGGLTATVNHMDEFVSQMLAAGWRC